MSGVTKKKLTEWLSWRAAGRLWTKNRQSRGLFNSAMVRRGFVTIGGTGAIGIAKRAACVKTKRSKHGHER